MFVLALWLLCNGSDEEEAGQYEEQDFRLISVYTASLARIAGLAAK